MMPKASLYFSRKRTFDDGYIVEIKVWRLPARTAERPHGLKYSLFFGRAGERIVGYDNEAGKGDHRHYRSREEPYSFRSLDRLLADFNADVEREMRRERATDQG